MSATLVNVSLGSIWQCLDMCYNQQSNSISQPRLPAGRHVHRVSWRHILIARFVASLNVNGVCQRTPSIWYTILTIEIAMARFRVSDPKSSSILVTFATIWIHLGGYELGKFPKNPPTFTQKSNRWTPAAAMTWPRPSVARQHDQTTNRYSRCFS